MKAACITIVFALWLTANFASAQTDTTFTYQGELQENGNPANGAFDFEFELWNAATGGNQIGNEFEADELPVVNGRFTVELDFGADAFDNSIRFLKIIVNGNPLSPRQPILTVPYAISTRRMYVSPFGVLTITPNDILDVIGESPTTLRIQNLNESGRQLALLNLDENHAQIQKRSTGHAVLDIDPMPVFHGHDATVRFFENSFTFGRKRIHNVGDYYGRGHVYLYAYEGDGSHGTAYVQARDDSGTSHIALRLRTQKSGSVVEAVHIDELGQVGIGTTNPIDKLDVRDTISGAAIRGTSSGPAPHGIGVVGRSEFGTGVVGSSGVHNGVVGISGSSDGFDFYANGFGQDYGSSSSRRWKSNIEPIDQPLEKISKLRGVYFDWDAEHGGHHDVGMIAEEVGEVMPEIVQYEENGIDASGMDYSKLTPLLVEVAKALHSQHQTQAELIAQVQKENKSLRSANEELHSRNDELVARLDSIEKLVQKLSSNAPEQSE